MSSTERTTTRASPSQPAGPPRVNRHRRQRPDRQCSAARSTAPRRTRSLLRAGTRSYRLAQARPARQPVFRHVQRRARPGEAAGAARVATAILRCWRVKKEEERWRRRDGAGGEDRRVRTDDNDRRCCVWCELVFWLWEVAISAGCR